jgi:hypothetical protein
MMSCEKNALLQGEKYPLRASLTELFQSLNHLFRLWASLWVHGKETCKWLELYDSGQTKIVCWGPTACDYIQGEHWPQWGSRSMIASAVATYVSAWMISFVLFDDDVRYDVKAMPPLWSTRHLGISTTSSQKVVVQTHTRITVADSFAISLPGAKEGQSEPTEEMYMFIGLLKFVSFQHSD